MDRLEPGDHVTGEYRTDAPEACTLEEWRLLGRPDAVAVIVDADADLEADYEALARLRHLTLRFPAFMDGRGFSHARRLRQRGFAGTLLAAGDILPDQWAFLERCGFTGITSTEIGDRAARLPVFDTAYQADEIQPEPLFRRRAP